MTPVNSTFHAESGNKYSDRLNLLVREMAKTKNNTPFFKKQNRLDWEPNPIRQIETEANENAD